MKLAPLSLPTVLQELRSLYSPPKSFLAHRNPFELIVATVLSAQCTDAQVNKITPALFARFPTAQAMADANPEELEKLIFTTGHYRAKTRHLLGLSSMLLEKFGGEVPKTMEELTQLPGVGRKTASIILFAAFDIVDGIAIDTHVIRLSRRLGFTKHKDAKRIELDLMDQVPKKDWAKVNPLLISHGRAVCTARVRKCHDCVFADRCPSSELLGNSDLAAR